MFNENSAFDELEIIRAQIDEIVASGALGRSKTYEALLLYLGDRRLKDKPAPKEIEIAEAVFGKDDFNPATDSSVRVYSHNLRKKIDVYYEGEGRDAEHRIRLATGTYRIEVAPNDAEISDTEPAAVSAFSMPHLFLSAVGGAALCLAAVMAATQVFDTRDAPSMRDEVPIWSDFAGSEAPILIVVGDFFVFREADEELERERIIRDVTINSVAGFNDYLAQHPERRDQVRRITNTYLTKGSAVALPHILSAIGPREDITIKLSSQVSTDDIRENNIVYVGLFKSLGRLETVLNGSAYAVAGDYNTLSRRDGSSEQLMIKGDPEGRHSDYGIFGYTRGPTGNHIVLMASFADTALVQIAKNTTSPENATEEWPLSYDEWTDFELVFEASGMGRTDLASDVIYSGSLDRAAIWETAPIPAE